MDKRKLNRVFKEIKAIANLDYAITNTDEYGDCNTCVTYELADQFGIDSRGIYAKHWLKGMNAGRAWKYIDSVYIGHDLTEVQGQILIDVFIANGYGIQPVEYDPTKAFLIKEEK
jgi:hypothetical protein